MLSTLDCLVSLEDKRKIVKFSCAVTTMHQHEESNIDNLAAKYDAEPANTAVDDELAALKAQMGIE